MGNSDKDVVLLEEAFLEVVVLNMTLKEWRKQGNDIWQF